MASSILHIKDAYYFEVPKALWGAEYAGIKPASGEDGAELFPQWLIRLDPEYLDWQASKLAGNADSLGIDLPDSWMSDYHHWLHADHANSGKPLSVYLESTDLLVEKLKDPTWAKAWESAQTKGSIEEFLSLIHI